MSHARTEQPVRLQKFLADAGVASRRRAEELIAEGHVLVNDEIVDTLPAFVRAADRVTVDGRLVRPAPNVYYAVHKPRNYSFGTRRNGGHSVVQFLPKLPVRLLPATPLAPEHSGLMIVTSDGELAQALARPGPGAARTYRADVRDDVRADGLARVRGGIRIDGVLVRAEQAELVHRGREGCIVEVTISDRHDRHVVQLLLAAGLRVRRLKRLQVGPISLRGLGPGQWRPLTAREVERLRRAAASAPPAPVRRQTTSSPSPRSGRSRRRGAGFPHAAMSERSPAGGIRRGPAEVGRRASTGERPGGPRRRIVT
ncbi:MAG: rRNA pseudouridine synthase [Phycisphaerae bacterium]|jgi:23S rRNA pseudouridine2605 synthase